MTLHKMRWDESACPLSLIASSERILPWIWALVHNKTTTTTTTNGAHSWCLTTSGPVASDLARVIAAPSWLHFILLYLFICLFVCLFIYPSFSLHVACGGPICQRPAWMKRGRAIERASIGAQIRALHSEWQSQKKASSSWSQEERSLEQSHSFHPSFALSIYIGPLELEPVHDDDNPNPGLRIGPRRRLAWSPFLDHGIGPIELLLEPPRSLIPPPTLSSKPEVRGPKGGQLGPLLMTHFEQNDNDQSQRWTLGL